VDLHFFPLGAVLAALFSSDHPGLVNALLLNSPLHTLNTTIPGFDKPVLFTDLWDVTSPVCLTYHKSLHKVHFRPLLLLVLVPIHPSC
jgi:pimeloyl-ACP methyl ester carboxylesterase